MGSDRTCCRMLNILGMNHHDQWRGLQGSDHLGAVIDSGCTFFSTPHALHGQRAFLGNYSAGKRRDPSMEGRGGQWRVEVLWDF